MRATKLWSQIEATFKQMDTAGTELECFQALRKQEQLAAAHRINTLWEEVQKQKELEQTLQKRYGYLLSEQERIHRLMNESREQARIQEENEEKQRALELAEAEEKQCALELAEAEEKQRALDLAETEGDVRQNALQLAGARAAENQTVELAEGSEVQEEILANQHALPLAETNFADKLQAGITADQNTLELAEVDVSVHQATELAETEGVTKIQEEVVGNQPVETEVAANRNVELSKANAMVNLQEELSAKQNDLKLADAEAAVDPTVVSSTEAELS